MDNQSGSETTRIDHLVVIGSPISTTNMGEFKRVSGKKGESHWESDCFSLTMRVWWCAITRSEYRFVCVLMFPSFPCLLLLTFSFSFFEIRNLTRKFRVAELVPRLFVIREQTFYLCTRSFMLAGFKRHIIDIIDDFNEILICKININRASSRDIMYEYVSCMYMYILKIVYIHI